MDFEQGEKSKQHPQRIVTNWRRFLYGLWRLPRGDIAAAYCADIFPKLKVFEHGGHRYMNGGNLFSGPVRSFVTCYPLIHPDEYTGPESVKYSYEGKFGTFKGERFRIGPKVIFESSDLSVEEWARMYRVIYADGGMFVHGLTYLEFLDREKPKTPNESAAIAGEVSWWNLHHGRVPETQDEMNLLIEQGVLSSPSIATPQLEFSL